MSTEKKNPFRRQQALDDAISRKFEEAWIFQTTIPRYKKMRMHEKGCTKIVKKYQIIFPQQPIH